MSMSTTSNIHPSALEVSAEVVEVTGGGSCARLRTTD